MDEDEEVILPVSELGKYLEIHNIFGHFDPTPCLEERLAMMSEIPDSSDRCYSQFGFICGQNIPEIRLMLLSMLHSFLCSEYLKKINNFVTSTYFYISCSNDFLQRKMRSVIQTAKVLLFRQSPEPLSKAEAVEMKFSLEYRMSKEITELKKCSAQIDSSTARLQLLIRKLLLLKPSNVNYSKSCNEVIVEIMNIRYSIIHLMEDMEKLLLCQRNSIERFRHRVENNFAPIISEPHPGQEMDSAQIEEQLCIVEEKTEVPTSEQLIFETEVPEKSNLENVASLRDEIFELNLDEDTFQSAPETSLFVEDTYVKEVKLIRAELLTHLRGTLSSRRADMEEREARAYVEHYGKPMERLNDEDHFETRPSHPSLSETKAITEAKPYSLQGYLNLGEEENFGDEIDEAEMESISAVKSEFLLSLQSAFRKRGC